MPRIGDTSKNVTKNPPSLPATASSPSKRLPLWLDVTTFPKVENGRWRILRVMVAAGGGACYSVMWGTVDSERSQKIEEAFELLGWKITRRTVDLGEVAGAEPTKKTQAEQLVQLDRLLKFLSNT
jgi:hypothetical protein